jgi:methylglutaconyl-CoA hydratase
MYKHLLLKRDSTKKSIVRITLNRPEVRNAFNPEMIQEITDIFNAISLDFSARLIILDGAGKNFCAGADLEWMKSMVNFSEVENRKDSLMLFEMFEAVLNCQKPVVSIAHGGVFGGALGLLAVSDIVIAEDSTQFCFSEVKLGLAPAVISCFVLKKLQTNQVSPLMISGKVFTTSEALKIGLVHDSYHATNLDEKINFWIKQFLEAAPQAVSATKKLTREIKELDWKSQRELACGLIAERRVSVEGQEGLKAFLEKRNPAWRNS